MKVVKAYPERVPEFAGARERPCVKECGRLRQPGLSYCRPCQRLMQTAARARKRAAVQP